MTRFKGWALAFFWLASGFGGFAFAQTETAAPGQWRAYLSHANVTQVRTDNRYVVGINNTQLVSYDTQQREYQAFNMINGLNDNTPVALHFDEISGFFFVGHASGMIDQFAPPNQIQPIADLFASQSASRKRIRCFASSGDLLYAGGDFGILAYDIVRQEVRFNYAAFPQAPVGDPAVTQLTVQGDSLYAVLTNGLLISGDRNQNLADISRWRVVSGTTGLPSAPISHLVAQTWGLVVVNEMGVWVRRPQSPLWQIIDELPSTLPYGFSVVRNKLFLEYLTEFWTYDGNTADETHFVPLKRSRQLAQTLSGWIGYADDTEGLTLQVPGSAELFAAGPFYPRHDAWQNLAVVNNRLYMSGCGTQGNFDLCFNSRDIHSITFPDRNYTTQAQNDGFSIDNEFWDVGYLAADASRGICYGSSWRTGIFAFKDGRYHQLWDNSNSCLSGLATSPQGEELAIQVVAMAADDQGTLWTAGYRTQEPLASISATGVCTRYSLPAGMSDRFNCALIDKQNRKWFGTTLGGILVWESPQQFRILNAANASLPTNSVRCLAEDRNGAIWVGTTDGVTVFFNAANILSPQEQASCPLAEGFCLLRNTEVSAIAIDGANRKWLATPSNGLYLVDPSGTRLLAHYEFRRSPLLDANINAIAYIPESGELFVATGRGLVSIKTTAIAPQTDNTNLLVYPNPLFTDYTGPVTLDGTADNSLVRVTTTSGLLVRELRSQGGRVVWDGTDIQGRRLAPGVYLMLAAERDGQNPGATKFVVLDRKRP